MADIPADAERLLKPFELGLRVAQGRRRAKISQAAFAQKLGVSRKTISDLERGAAEHVSLKTAMAALSLAGFVPYVGERRERSHGKRKDRGAAGRDGGEGLLNCGGWWPVGSPSPTSALPSASPSP